MKHDSSARVLPFVNMFSCSETETGVSHLFACFLWKVSAESPSAEKKPSFLRLTHSFVVFAAGHSDGHVDRPDLPLLEVHVAPIHRHLVGLLRRHRLHHVPRDEEADRRHHAQVSSRRSSEPSPGPPRSTGSCKTPHGTRGVRDFSCWRWCEVTALVLGCQVSPRSARLADWVYTVNVCVSRHSVFSHLGNMPCAPGLGQEVRTG